MKNGICPKCNSHRVIKDKPILDRGHYNMPINLSLTIRGKRTSWITHHMATGELRAWICGDCGYTEIYTTNSTDLFEAEREAQRGEG